MATATEIWRPGSFTKNFSWGRPNLGLSELHETIRLGFDGQMKDVPREEFRRRVKATGRPDYIPINFFLFNRSTWQGDYLCADELVFQALNWPHSPAFDKLALFVFNLSIVGRWRQAKPYQRRPALWANAYVRERVAHQLNWNTRPISADDIQSFVMNDPRYKAETTRKLATNLNYLFNIGRLREFNTPRFERWWVDCLFLALDRILGDLSLHQKTPPPAAEYGALLDRYGFMDLTGKKTVEKELAVKHLATLYEACGGRSRFSEDAVKERTQTLLPDIERFAVNDPRPRGAVHMTNPRILKSIPPACAMLAKYAGFEDISPDDLEEFDLEDFIKRRTQEALAKLKRANIKPNMTAEELMKLTRGE